MFILPDEGKIYDDKITRDPITYLGIQIATLLHQGANGEPKAVGQRELILDHFGACVTGVRVVPFVGADPRDHEHHHRDEDVRGEHV